MGQAGVFYFFVDAVKVQRLGSEDADHGAEDIHLLHVDVDKPGGFALDVINGLADGGGG